MFCETHNRTINPVNEHGGFVGGIHCNPADLAHFSKGMDVGDGLAVEPDLAEVWEIPNEGGLLETTVGREGHGCWA